MNVIYGFLRLHKELALATVGSDGKPKIRVFQVMKIEEQTNTLSFATAPGKEVYGQLQNNPSVELLAMSGNISVRITGNAVFDVPDEIAREIYSTNPVLPRLYGNYRELVYFRVSMESLDCYDLSTNPPSLQHYKF